MSHTERAHARLSASGAKRWLSCTPSAMMEDQFPESTSDFAEEGTFAHEYSELQLRYYFKMMTAEKWEATHKALLESPKGQKFYSNDLADYVDKYMDMVIERYNAALSRSVDAQLIIEERLDFSKWVPEGFGTGDILIIADGMIEVIDLKYGKGVKVEAQDNPQMRLYGLGALEAHGHLYDIQQVLMTIIQPRLDHISTEEMSAADLVEWAEDHVRPRAELADKGEGEMVAGDHCRFCKAKAVCRGRAEHNLELAKYEFRKADLLTHDEIGEILKRADELQQWAKDVQEYALDQAENHGVKFPNWKLVEGRSTRKYTDEVAIAETLIIEGWAEAVIYQPRKLYGITDMTKIMGKKAFDYILEPFIEKPPGKPALVPESDKRPELNSTASAVRDFE